MITVLLSGQKFYAENAGIAPLKCFVEAEKPNPVKKRLGFSVYIPECFSYISEINAVLCHRNVQIIGAGLMIESVKKPEWWFKRGKAKDAA